VYPGVAFPWLHHTYKIKVEQLRAHLCGDRSQTNGLSHGLCTLMGGDQAPLRLEKDPSWIWKELWWVKETKPPSKKRAHSLWWHLCKTKPIDSSRKQMAIAWGWSANRRETRASHKCLARYYIANCQGQKAMLRNVPIEDSRESLKDALVTKTQHLSHQRALHPGKTFSGSYPKPHFTRAWDSQVSGGSREEYRREMRRKLTMTSFPVADFQTWGRRAAV
jgi:hypothetical protein